jgi:hypothetical protein
MENSLLAVSSSRRERQASGLSSFHTRLNWFPEKL